MVKRKEQREEGQGQKADAGKEERAGEDGANGAFEAGAGANLIQVADGLHGGGGEDFAGGGRENDGGDHGGRGPRSGVRGGRGWSSRLLLVRLRRQCFVAQRRGGSLGEGRPLRDEAHAEGDEHDSGPALQGDGLMEPEAGEQGDDDVAEGRGGKDEGEVGPGERGEIAGEEADEQRDAEGDPGSEDRGDEGERDGPA